MSNIHIILKLYCLYDWCALVLN